MDAASVLDAALRALARRDLTVVELEARLERAGFGAGDRERAVAYLREAGYLDDARVALERARRLAERGASDAAVRADLARRGVDREVAERAVASLEPEPERAARVAARLGEGPRAARALARRGFSEDAVERVLARVVANPP